MRPLSHSSISTYKQCPLRYKLTYMDGLESEPHPELSFGSSLHEALHYFYSVVPPPPSLEGLMTAYEEAWVSEGYGSADEGRKYFDYGKRLLKDFYDIHITNYRIPIAVEHKFNVEIAGYPVTGFIDRIDKLDTGGAEIIDYKSGVSIKNTTQVSRNQQLALYQIGVEETLGMKVEKLTLYHLRSQTPVSSSARTKEELLRIETLVGEVGRAIESEEFEPRHNEWCPCDFPQHCPHYMQEHFPAKERAEITSVVEEYAKLKTKERELEERLEELAAEIHKYCEKESVARIYGKKHVLYRNEMTKRNFDADEVRGILGPLGMWDKVLGFDSKLLKELLEAPETSDDLKEKIRALERVKKYYQLRYGRIKPSGDSSASDS